jgi:hypothetical protein
MTGGEKRKYLERDYQSKNATLPARSGFIHAFGMIPAGEAFFSSQFFSDVEVNS